MVVEEEVLSYISNKKSRGAVPLGQQLGSRVKVVEFLNTLVVVVLLILSAEEAVLSEVPPSLCMINHVLSNRGMK